MSSPATLLSVVCYGLQDTRLLPPKGQPDIRYYAKVLKKTTRWAAQTIRVDFDGQPDFGRKVTCTIPRKAELLTQVTLVVTMPDIYTPQQNARSTVTSGKFQGPSFGWTNSLGHAMIALVELDIGGVNVDRFDGVFMEMHDELYEPITAIRSKNRMINRVANGFNERSIGYSATPTVCYINIPFWFSRGDYAQALPIDALTADSIQIHITFRPISQLYYTPSRQDPRTVGFNPAFDVSGNMPPILNSPFYLADPLASTRVFRINPNNQNTGIGGVIMPGYKMPSVLPMGDAYLLLEYISLEETESVAIRSSQIDYHVEQHYIVPVQATQRALNVRLRLPYSNPTKDIMWALQRPEAQLYNAWFLFTREFYDYSKVNPWEWWNQPWWPNAVITSGDQHVPAFRYAYSEPILGATFGYGNMTRFTHETSPSFFRSFLPLIHYRKAPVFDRYIYVYPFGLAPGARDDSSLGPAYGPRGASNWEKLPKKEMRIVMNPDTAGNYPDLNIYSYVTSWNVFRVFGGRGVMLFGY
jgi:hypothetical protein